MTCRRRSIRIGTSRRLSALQGKTEPDRGAAAAATAGGQADRVACFAERFGAGILVSVIDGAIQVATQPDTENGSTVIYSPSTTQDIATETLKSTINIRPTLSKAQGDRIQALVARDIDFRSVYELKASNE